MSTTERPLDLDLQASLQQGHTFLYAHLVKFERAKGTQTGEGAKGAKDFGYITDASFDIAYNDGSFNADFNADLAWGPHVSTAKLVQPDTISEDEDWTGEPVSSGNGEAKDDLPF